MYNGRYPIRRMYRVDRFGWSKKLHGADDYKSMRADNTSAFNCRSVVNRPGVCSPHARGRAVDINTWENPYRSATGLVPNSWWASRSHPQIAWRSSSHPVVRIWRSHGFRWTYGTGDSQHVDGRQRHRRQLPAASPAELTALTEVSPRPSSFHFGSLSHSSLRSLTFSSARAASASVG